MIYKSSVWSCIVPWQVQSQEWCIKSDRSGWQDKSDKSKITSQSGKSEVTSNKWPVRSDKLKGECKKKLTKLAPQFLPTFFGFKHARRLDIIHMKNGIHSSIWSTKTFLYDIRAPRYKQFKMGYQILKISDIRQSKVLDSDVTYCFIYIPASLCFRDMCLNMQHF